MIYRSLCMAILLAASSSQPAAFAQRAAKGEAETVQTHLQNAQKAQQEGDLYRAESEYRQALGLSLEQLGSIYSKLGDLDKAELAYRSGSHATVDSEASLLGLGVIYLRKGAYEKGVEVTRAVLAQNAFDPQARDLLGKLYFAMNRFDAAAQELEEAVRLEPDNFSASFALALAFLKQQRLEQARKVFDQMLQQAGESARLHVLYGVAYRQTEFFEDAVKEFQKAIKLDPTYRHVHYLLALAYLSSQPNKEKNRLPEAVQELRAELRRNPDDYVANCLLGVVFVDDRKFQEAIPYLEKARRLDAQKPEPDLYLGQALYLSGEPEKAIPVLRRAVELTPDPSHNAYAIANGVYMLGQALLHQGKTDEAKHYLALAEQYKSRSSVSARERLKIYLQGDTAGPADSPDPVAGKEGSALVVVPPPPNPSEQDKLRKAAQIYAEIAATSYNQLGQMHARQSDFKHAAQDFEQAAAWDAAIPDVDYNLGLAQFKAQNYNEAIAPLEKVRAQQHKRKDVQILLGMSYFFSDDYTRAKEQLGPLVEGGLDDPQASYALGLSLVHSGEQERGEKLLRDLVQRFPQVADAHLALGQALALSERYELAKAEFAKTLELDPIASEAHYYLGLAFLRQSNFSEAAKELQQEITQNPQEAKAEYHLGLCLLSMNQTDDAIHSFNEAVRLNPAYADAYYEMGKVRLGQGQTQEAVSLLEKAVQLEGNRPYIQYQLSLAYLKAGKSDAAQAALVRYRELKAREHKQPRGQGDASEQ